MKCKACGKKTNLEQTKITIVFPIKEPEQMDIKMDNKYKKLSPADVIINKDNLIKVFKKCLDKITTELTMRNMDRIEARRAKNDR